jgi:hypothetical protein
LRNPALCDERFCLLTIRGLDTGLCGERRAQAMTHPVAKEFLARANSALILALICGGLAVCAFGGIAFDLSRWFAH